MKRGFACIRDGFFSRALHRKHQDRVKAGEAVKWHLGDRNLGMAAQIHFSPGSLR